MVKLDVRSNIEAHDRLLAQLDNPRHRRIISNYRRHTILEVAGTWEPIFDEDMTVEEPVYVMDALGDRVLRGRSQVMAFYRELTDSKKNVIVVTDQDFVVDDGGFGYQNRAHMFMHGKELHELGEDVDPHDDEWYVRTVMAVGYWPFDERARMIGEESTRVGPVTLRSIPASEVITPEEARASLLPLLQPLTPYDPDQAA